MRFLENLILFWRSQTPLELMENTIQSLIPHNSSLVQSTKSMKNSTLIKLHFLKTQKSKLIWDCFWWDYHDITSVFLDYHFDSNQILFHYYDMNIIKHLHNSKLFCFFLNFIALVVRHCGIDLTFHTYLGFVGYFLSYNDTQWVVSRGSLIRQSMHG